MRTEGLFDRRMLAHFDWVLLGLAYLIPILGLVVLFSAGYDPEGKDILLHWLPGDIQSIPFSSILFNKKSMGCLGDGSAKDVIE